MLSVIVPVYHGKSYVKDIIGMVERNATNVNMPVELIFVNDSPEERIDDICISSRLQIMILNNAGNQGIHYSRIRGIRDSHGEYILMLDQDDKISDNFLSCQMVKMGKADMVVANGYEELTRGNRVLYRYFLMQWTVKFGIFYTVFGSRILSPGQCLIRRGSIPELWFETVIKNNGADDYLLWIYMFRTKSRIKINRDRLYVHRIAGNNASGSVRQMEQSLLEVIDIAVENKALSLSAYRYIKNGVAGKQTVFRKIAGGIVKIGNAMNRRISG